MNSKNEIHEVSRRDRIIPQLALFAIASFVTIYDVVCKENRMLSQEVDRLRESPTTGRVTNWALDTLYNHLKRSVSPDEDPIHRFATYFGKDQSAHGLDK